MIIKKIPHILILTLLMLIIGCGGKSTEDIEIGSLPTLTESISQTLDISQSNLKVLDYTLIQESDQKYSGLLKTEYDGLTQTFNVKVLWDHSTDEFTVEWEFINEV